MQISTNLSHYGTTVVYNCSSGYKFPDELESRESMCGLDFKWHPEIVQCEGKSTTIPLFFSRLKKKEINTTYVK